jgi:cytochrome P450 / NADPH-cytochrome P450 reductase
MAGKGLFTAETSDPEWGKAHRILMPAFGPQSVRDYFGPMLDIAEQLIVKWERLGEKVDHDVADNMTRLKVLSQRHFETDIAYMNEVVDELIRERKSGATRGERDLLSLMLDGRDPVTGERLDDLNIRQQMVTLLIAGHETTSGLLSFALYELLRHPELLAKARAEVDAVLGTATPRFEHLSRLTWVDQVLRETLRLWPTAPAFAVTPVAPTRLGDVLDVVPGDDLLVLIPTLHRDSSVWGGDAERFDPERFAPGRRESIPPNAWKPFGTGQRACIGRPFAMQEATLVLAMLLQRFDLVPGDYQLTVKETLTLKPEGLRMRVRSRGLVVADVFS